MGLRLTKRVGSDPYYASYERSFEHLSSEKHRLEGRVTFKKGRHRVIEKTIVNYGLAGFALAAAYAAWVLRQPPGRFTSREHTLRILPLFLEPLTAFIIHWVVLGCLHWVDQRDERKLASLQRKLRKMVLELKDSTRYEKTQALLERYDPDYVPPTPRSAARSAAPLPGPAAATPQATGRRPSWPPAALPRQMTGGAQLALTGLQRGGMSLLPAFDRLAATLVGDNPVLMDSLRAARSEAEGLRARLAETDAAATRLAAENAELRARLGLPPPAPEPGPAAAQKGHDDEPGQYAEPRLLLGALDEAGGFAGPVAHGLVAPPPNVFVMEELPVVEEPADTVDSAGERAGGAASVGDVLVVGDNGSAEGRTGPEGSVAADALAAAQPAAEVAVEPAVGEMIDMTSRARANHSGAAGGLHVPALGDASQQPHSREDPP